ncbi:VPS10 domain-containing receptor SorCS1-like isoform X1 [Leucoraja erinacea]|uniref:VPS10 domain-containing receptor SorCS1-like isoform X1 n=1 Tax=Leucoraja erinaceus TaxID=7782 RepID=UPI0024579688|nr:VPS10 domain-containing receptor SorCS1-like isoform X1 [Leucoraja erinacea]
MVALVARGPLWIYSWILLAALASADLTCTPAPARRQGLAYVRLGAEGSAGRWRRGVLDEFPAQGVPASGEDGDPRQEAVKVTNSRPEEMQLTSTTFALTGDSAHNQAMVHWSGQNSSVILILTKLYDHNLGSVTESSLWRSTDYGTTYEKLNDKVGLKTVLSYLYVCPTNKRKIMLVSDPEIESSVLISSDEGATYQKYRQSFQIQSMLFHPEEEDWILAYSQDQKLYSSSDFGRRWQLVHERITPNRFYWSVKNLDMDPDLVHIEARTADGHAEYITCRIQNCSEAASSKLFPGYIDHNSLVVQDDYVFAQVTSGGRVTYYVSYRREDFAEMKLPKYSLPKDMHIISTDENQVFAAVQEWNQNDTYNLYVSDARGTYFTVAMENVKSSRGPEGNVMIDLYEVAGIKGMFLANKKVQKQVKTFITYNKGRDWRLLEAPTTDLRGKDLHCLLPYCSLNLHLNVAQNPYTSGNIGSKDSAPGIIVASGNVGPELKVDNDNPTGSMFISTDGGNSWRQIFEEEHSILFLDQGGALVAIKHTPQPIRHLWLSFDEGRSWRKYSFTSVPLFVDGVLGEPGEETLVMTVFGHLSHRSEWQLVKVDYRSIFSRKCMENDFQVWTLHTQGEPCIIGETRIYKRRRPATRCILGKKYREAVTYVPCNCTDKDFECDFGYERHSDGRCLPAFWYNPSFVTKECSMGQSYLNSTGYRKVGANNCTGGVRDQYTAQRHPCSSRAPRGLHLITSDGRLATVSGQNVTFIAHLEEGDIPRTRLQIEFGDGTAVIFANLSSVKGGIKHVYKHGGIYRVIAQVKNNLGSTRAILFLHVNCPIEHVHLTLPYVAITNQEVNLTAVVLPSTTGPLTYFWWIENKTEPIVTLEDKAPIRFSTEGITSITIQVSDGNSILQDVKSIAVFDSYRSLLLSFTPNLEDHNPDIPEWRQDLSKLVKRTLGEVTALPEQQMLLAILPGLPTAAELYILPHRDATEEGLNSMSLEQISDMVINALNQNRVQFELKPGVRIIASTAHLTLAPLVDSGPGHSGSALLMLLSLAFVGLAVFLIYKFKRKIPGINVYAQMQNEKEQEMISPITQIEGTPNFTQSELTSPEDQHDTQKLVADASEHHSKTQLPVPLYPVQCPHKCIELTEIWQAATRALTTTRQSGNTTW